ncbi:MAG: 16S rRNA (guanine(966)-N(2))-methyltransferase RsmD [Phycisphaerales bacterium]
MRIIAGQYKSRRILPPPDAKTRPITDRVKEALFNHLRGRTEGAHVVDLFSGTGSVGLEALSRGAARVLFVEKSRPASNLLKRNIESLGAGDECAVYVGDALGPAWLARAPRPIDLVFCDPPYELMTNPRTAKLVLETLGRLAAADEVLREDAMLVLRTPWPVRAWVSKAELEAGAKPSPEVDLSHPALEGPETRVYNQMALNFYQPAAR